MRKTKAIGFVIVCGSMALSLVLLSSCTPSGAPSCEDGNVKRGVLNEFFSKYKNRYADAAIARYVYHTDRVTAEMDKLGGKLQPNPQCPGYKLGMGFDALKKLVDTDRKATVGPGPDHSVDLFILRDDIDRASKISPDDYMLSGVKCMSKDDVSGKSACSADITQRKTGGRVGSVAYIARRASNGVHVEITRGSALNKEGRPARGFEKLFQ